MKRISLILPAIAAIAMVSCDDISEADRFIPAEIVPQRSILLEEFTGQECTNCPDGHKAIHEITASLGDSVVPVGVHASGLSIPGPIGLRTDTGEEYYKAAGSPALPTAVINLQTSPLKVEEWGAAIDRLIMNSTPFTVIADASLNGKNYDIKVDFSSGDDYEGKLMVWVCENDIVRYQLDHGVSVTDYVHNHVFRAAATPDIWGDPVSLKAHEPQHKEYTVVVEPNYFWNTDNLYVVAFLYNDSGVAQVTSSHN